MKVRTHSYLSIIVLVAMMGMTVACNQIPNDSKISSELQDKINTDSGLATWVAWSPMDDVYSRRQLLGLLALGGTAVLTGCSSHAAPTGGAGGRIGSIRRWRRLSRRAMCR